VDGLTVAPVTQPAPAGTGRISAPTSASTSAPTSASTSAPIGASTSAPIGGSDGGGWQSAGSIDAARASVAAATAVATATQGDAGAGECRYLRPVWRPAGPPRQGRPPRVALLDLADEPLRLAVGSELAGRGVTCVSVVAGADYGRRDDGTYTLIPGHPDHCRRVMDDLAGRGLLPDAFLRVPAAGARDASADVREGFHAPFWTAVSILGRNGGAPLRAVVAHGDGTGLIRPAYAAVAGTLRTLALEHSRFTAARVEVDPGTSGERLAALLAEELCAESGGVTEVRYDSAGRHVRGLDDFTPADVAGLPLRPGGTYLITGGAGALGLLVAEFLAGHGPVNLVLTGRSPLDETRRARVEALDREGVRVRYLAADIAVRSDAERLLQRVREEFGALHGVVHAAGVTRDARAVLKTPGEVAEVLAPKIDGALHLDALTRDDPLDFFVLFSSATAEMGNLGQADYAYANGFLDAFAREREQERQAGRRAGRTVAIGYPLWREGGMAVDEATERLMARHWGIAPLSTPAGLEAFRRALAGDEPSFVVFQPAVAESTGGPGARDAAMPSRVAYEASGAASGGAPAHASEEGGGQHAEGYAAHVERDLRAVAARFLLVDQSEVDPDADLMELGFDSVSLTELINEVNERYSLELLPTVLFECPTLTGFAAYLDAHHRAELAARHGNRERPADEGTDRPAADEPVTVAAEPGAARGGDAGDGDGGVREPHGARGPVEVAVVGMAGMLPGSSDLTEFWRHLMRGDDLVGPVPDDRADLRADDRTRHLQGGFLDDVAAFDAGLFGISPAEAALMDPQQRLFLQAAWRAIEDAGHRPSELAGTATGLFAGVATSDYDALLTRHGVPVQAHMATGVAHAVLANRVSHLLDLRGPSEAVDTACSSALVAIHRAVRAIQAGECETALAGGVNVLLNPDVFVAFTQSGMLSPDGRCKTFDAAADGYVRGEGVGVVMLKPLDRALAEGDHVYAVVRGTAVNHCGRSASLTAPNPEAQADVLVRAHREAGADPATVTYIEAHGTGTRLGDPIEIEGLKKAFSRLYEEWGRPMPRTPHIGIGSVKTNIGHLEAAAGIAGVLKVLLAMEHGELPATLHRREVNPYLRLDGTPFHLVDAALSWPVTPGPDGRPIRRAGVSSFGFGGSNAHVVLERAVTREEETVESSHAGPELFVLSAPTRGALRAYATRLAGFLAERPGLELSRVAYTLQAGREELRERLAVVAASHEELVSALRAAAEGDTAARGDRATGDTTPGHHGVIHLGTAARNAGPCDEEDLHALARAWVAGARVDWAAHRARRAGRGARPPRRLPMPSFPFSRTRFWFTREESRPVPEVITEVTVQKPNQHVRHSMGPRPARRARVRLAPPDAARGQEDPAWPGEPRERPEPAARGVAAPADGGRTASSEPAALHAPPELTPRPVAAPAFVRVTAEAAAPVTRSIREHLARILAMPAEEIEGDRPFAELGLDSIFRMDLARKLGAAYGLELKAEDMYEHDSVDALAAHITSLTAPSGGRPTHDGDARGSHTPNGHAPAAGAPAGGALSGNRTSEMNGNHAFAMRGDDAEHGDGREAAERAVRDLVESVIRRPLDPTRSFEHNALTSFDMLRVISALEKRLGGLRKSLLFDRPTLAELTRWLRDTFGAAAVASLGASGDGAPSRVGPGIPDGATGSSASRAVESSAEEKGAPLIVPRAAVAGRPGLREVVADLERRYAKETGLAGRDIAPLLFLGSSRQGFFTFSQRDDDLFSWSYVGSEEHFTELAAEYLDYARGRGLRASFLSLRRLEEAGGHRLTATPFGAVQRLEDLSRFTLKGGRMSRLRYMVQRFERSGSCRTVEYRSGSDPATDRRLAELVDRWAGGKQMTNPYVRRVREEIREGLLDERHRVFLTYLDDALANAVVVTRIPSENGYLLDVEFYPADGPLGGLEYAIVQIIGVLVAEGCTLFSFGASFGAKVCDSPNAAPEVEQGLEELRGAGIFGAGNFQFKNKFRPVNVPLYLCQPADGPRTPVADVILMIADPSAPTGITAPAAPDRPTASDDGPASDGRAAVSAPAAVAVSSGPSRRGDAGPAVTAEEREALLAAHGHNPLRLPPEAVEFDLVTDSWAERTDEVVARRAEELIRRAAEPGAGDELTPPWLPFETVVAAPSGRAAEALLCRSWPGRRGAVPHNGLFPTLLFNLADNGFDPVPLPSVSSGHFGGDLDLAALDRALEAGEIAFVAVELTGNAGGGAPVSAANLRQVRERAAAQGVPVVVDATRVVENAVFVAEHEPGHQGRGVWDVVRDLLSLADVVTMSATKDFGVHAGGLVATRLPEVAARLREEAELRGPGLNLLDRRALSLALADCEGVLKLVRQRMRGVRTLWRSLDAAGVPLAGPTGGPPGGHCLLLDLSRMDHLAGLPHPVPSFLAWMFRETGVRGGPHLAGDRLVRLAVPLGYGKAEIDLVAERLTGLFGSAAEVPCLVTAEEPVTALDAARAAYRPAGEVPSDIQDVLREGYRPADQNWAAVREAAPGVRRTLVAYVGGQVEVLSAGEGPTLLLMHPFNMGAGVFARQFRDLAGRCRVVVIHHPGVGATTADGDISLDGITALHFDVLRRLGVEFPVHVAGASFGSLLAQNFALRHPEATASLSIICGSYKYANRAGAVNRLERVVAEDLDHIVAGSGSARIREQRDDLEAALLRCESMDPRIGLRYLDVFAAEPDLLGRLPGISVPTLIVQGRHDSVIPLKTAHLLHGLIPDARYVEIPDAGHFPCVTHPEEVNHALAGFLRLGAGDERPGAAGRTASIKEGQGRR
jgi:3-oxoacyl-(acyl-carrier-protein) synthase/tryptophanase/pimeloyl-ACP methyl ester carboxylesterase/acyl carrier protein/NAD(P)-dependent dehydrogenase (short-subunit alcohol dehydrogenase family)